MICLSKNFSKKNININVKPITNFYAFLNILNKMVNFYNFREETNREVLGVVNFADKIIFAEYLKKSEVDF